MDRPNALARKLLLVGWDAADWLVINPLLEAGKMPHLQKLIDHGVMGNILTLQPVLSPILWTSIATGKHAAEHGVLGFVEPTADGTGVQPVTSTSRQVKAIWNMLEQSGLKCHCVGWFASHPAEPTGGVCVSDQFAAFGSGVTADNWPVTPGSVHPPAAAEALSELRLHPDDLTYDALTLFIPAARAMDRSKPEVMRLLGFLAKHLARCMTVHAVITDLIEREPWDFATVYYEAIDQIGHEFMAFHPPKMDHLPPEVYETFQYVMNATYEFHDHMLGKLLELAGEDVHVVVVSDHGFLSGERRPTELVEAAQWHRNFGMFVAKGTGLKQDALVHGATLLDVAPTVLTLLGLPVGRDMAGRVLVNAFEDTPKFERIDSWETSGPPRERAPAAEDPAVAAEAIRQLVELGYLDAPSEDVQKDVERARTEQRYNLAASQLGAGRAALAVPVAAALVTEHFGEPRYAALLGQTAAVAGDVPALRQAIASLEVAESRDGAIRARQLPLFRGLLAVLENEPARSLAHFHEASAKTPSDPWIHCRVGRACLRLRRWHDARAAFDRALAIDPECTEAHYGLSVALARLDDTDGAIDHGLRAINLQNDFPLAHFQLGAVLSRVGDYDRAMQAFELCLTMRPHFALAYRYLARLHARHNRVSESLRAREAATRILALKIPQPAVD